MNTKLKIATTVAALTLAITLIVPTTAANAGHRGWGAPSNGQAFRALPVAHAKSNVMLTGKSTSATFRYEPRRTLTANSAPQLQLPPSKRAGGTKFLDGRGGVASPTLPVMTVKRLDGVKLVGGRTVKHIGMTKLLANGRPVKDTCNSSQGDDETCNPDKLAARCDAAGGGMSSQPGGGVDCDTSHWD